MAAAQGPGGVSAPACGPAAAARLQAAQDAPLACPAAQGERNGKLAALQQQLLEAQQGAEKAKVGWAAGLLGLPHQPSPQSRASSPAGPHRALHHAGQLLLPCACTLCLQADAEAKADARIREVEAGATKKYEAMAERTAQEMQIYKARARAEADAAASEVGSEALPAGGGGPACWGGPACRGSPAC